MNKSLTLEINEIWAELIFKKYKIKDKNISGQITFSKLGDLLENYLHTKTVNFVK